MRLYLCACLAAGCGPGWDRYFSQWSEEETGFTASGDRCQGFLVMDSDEVIHEVPSWLDFDRHPLSPTGPLPPGNQLVLWVEVRAACGLITVSGVTLSLTPPEDLRDPWVRDLPKSFSKFIYTEWDLNRYVFFGENHSLQAQVKDGTVWWQVDFEEDIHLLEGESFYFQLYVTLLGEAESETTFRFSVSGPQYWYDAVQPELYPDGVLEELHGNILVYTGDDY